MAKTVSISKYLFATICALTVIFGIGFLLTLSKLSERQLSIVADIPDGKWIQDGNQYLCLLISRNISRIMDSNY
jgi:hypothetical protein